MSRYVVTTGIIQGDESLQQDLVVCRSDATCPAECAFYRDISEMKSEA